MPDSPFARYLRQIDSRLRMLPLAQRELIRRELTAHLEDAATEQQVDPADTAFQAAVIRQLGPAPKLAANLGAVHGAIPLLWWWMAQFAGAFGGGLGIFGGMFAVGLSQDFGLAGLLAIVLLICAGALGVHGVALREHQPTRGYTIVVGCGLVLTAGGALIWHGPLAHSFDLLAGAMVLLSGSLMLLSATTHPVIARRRRAHKALLATVALALVSFVAPFSYLPNPLGMYYLMRGGYRFQPNTWLMNGFATIGTNPAPLVAARLDQLIGQTGLDPLDANVPLQSYTLQQVITDAGGGMNYVDAKLQYANGRTQRYRIPITQFGWQPRVEITGIDRLLTEHRALPGLVPAQYGAPVRLGRATRLPLDSAAQQLFVDDVFADAPLQQLEWAGNGRQLFFIKAAALWSVDIRSGYAQRIAEGVHGFALSADAQSIAWTQSIPPQGGGAWQYRVIVRDQHSGTQRAIGEADRPIIASAADGVYFLHDSVLWRAAWGTGPAEQLGQLPDAGALYADDVVLALAPDGQRVAYRCGSDLCLADTNGKNAVRIALGFEAPAQPGVSPPDAPRGPQPTAGPADFAQPHLATLHLTWRVDGAQLAVTSAATDTRGVPELRIVSRAGVVVQQVQVAADGSLEAPQWAADNRLLVLTAYPANGRRIVAVELASSTVFDLSQPHWDAFASLMTDARTLLLWNGRGGFWQAPLLEAYTP